MNKLKFYEIDAVVSKVLTSIHEEQKKKQPNLTKESKKRLALEAKINELKNEIASLNHQMFDLGKEVAKKCNTEHIRFDTDKGYSVQDESWKLQQQVKQEVILSQIVSDNLEEVIAKLVKQFAK
jgi:septal ring factor EnvC (AmiA/AmiB activator)